MRARLEDEALRRGLDIPGQVSNPYEKYQTDPLGYAATELEIHPWAGRGSKGQRELYEDIAESVKRQLAGLPACRIFKVDSGNGLGKTFGVAPLVNWFFDAFAPSICYTTAPSADQVRDLMWKYVKSQRKPHLPGRVLPADPKMIKRANHFAVGKTTGDGGGQGEERMKGQHDRFLMFAVDEAEGVKKFVFDAILRMMTGGEVIIVILIGNPRSRSSAFYKWGRRPGVMNYRWSALNHPNVVDGAETVPGATNREWVIGRIWEWCEVVERHDPDNYTFDLPFDVPPPPEDSDVAEAAKGGSHGPPGTIFLPNAEFLTSVMGIPPANSADDTLVPSGRYESATKRKPPEDADPVIARIGVDVSGFGKDYGTIYVRWKGKVWRAGQMWKRSQNEYAQKIKEIALGLLAQGAKDVQVRIDAGGGFAGGVIDILEGDDDLRPRSRDKKNRRGSIVVNLGGSYAQAPVDPTPRFDNFEVIPVHFNAVPYDTSAYADLATEMLAHAAETLKGIALVSPPETLEADLTERKYDWRNVRGVWVKEIESKKIFRKAARLGRSPDDGDGFMLCVAPDFLFPEGDDGGVS